MDDFQNLLYIVIAVIYIIARVLKSKDKANKRKIEQAGQVEQENPPQRRIKEKGLTFEEFFEELKKVEKNDIEEPHVKAKPSMSIEPRQSTFIKPTQSMLRKEKKSHKPIVPTQQPMSLEEKGMKYADKGKSLLKDKMKGSFGSYEQSMKKGNYYGKLLKEEGGAKNAVILSEILNRKYF